jgi:hypothetical protein
VWDVRRGGVAEPADRGDFRPRGQIARAGNHAAVDRIAHDDVETELRRSRAPAHGEPGVEHELGHLRGHQRVLLGRHHLDRIDPRRIVPGEMQVRVAKAGHQRRAHAVDDRLPAASAGGKARRALRHLPDSIALDDDLARVGVLA